MYKQTDFKDNHACSSIIPNGEDIIIKKNDCEMKVDISVDRIKSVVIWGHVRDCENRPVANALVKALKYIDDCRNELEGICHTYTDREGFYQFDLANCYEGRYRIMVSKCAHDYDRQPCHERPISYKNDHQDCYPPERDCHQTQHSSYSSNRDHNTSMGCNNIRYQ